MARRSATVEPSISFRTVNLKCACGHNFSKKVPTYTLTQIEKAVHRTFSGVVPSYIWDAMKEHLEDKG
jgi:hypothetical protein